MMIDTGTICPFPYAWPSTINFTTNPAECTLTYAQRLGADHDVYQAVLGIISFSCLLFMITRLVFLRRFAHSQRMKLRDLPSFSYFCFSFLFVLAFSLETIDLYAFRAWYPPALYYILDEIVASSLIAVAVVVVDFWVRCARGIGNSSTGLPLSEKYFILFAVFTNFLGWIIVGLCDSGRFYLYEGIKSIGGSIILMGFMIRSGVAVRKLHLTLTKTSSQIGKVEPSQSTNKAVHILVRKFSQFCFVLALASMALLANGFISLRLDSGMDWQWKVTLAEQYDAIQIVLRVVYILGALTCLTFFRVPKSEFAANSRKSHTAKDTFQSSAAGDVKPAFFPTSPVVSSLSSSLKQLLPASMKANHHAHADFSAVVVVDSSQATLPHDNIKSNDV